jgi:hypothetical protein
MADKIVKIVREDNSDASIKAWHISYKIEDGGALNEFVEVIKASEMTDSSSESEAKIKANTKASAKKAAWIIEKASASSIGSESEPDETVTL